MTKETSSCNIGASSIPSSLLTHRRLQILPLHTLVLLASEELKFIAEGLIKPLRYDPVWEKHADKTFVACSAAYEKYAWELQKVIDELGVHSQIATTAVTHLHHFSHLSRRSQLATKRTEQIAYPHDIEIINWYLNNGYNGMGCTLFILLFLGTPLSEDWDLAFIGSRQNYLEDIGPLLASSLLPDINRIVGGNGQVTVEQFQMYIPGKLLEHTALRKHVRTLNHKDWLGRSVHLLEYDAGFAKTYGLSLIHI